MNFSISYALKSLFTYTREMLHYVVYHFIERHTVLSSLQCGFFAPKFRESSLFENVTDEMVETFAVCGTENECRKKTGEYRNYIDLPILSAPHYFIDFELVKNFQNRVLRAFGK